MTTQPDQPAQVPAVIQSGASVKPLEFSKQEEELIRQIFAKACTTKLEFDLFFTVCRTVALHPLFRQIYALRFEGSMVIHIGIHGKVAIAQRSGDYAGIGAPIFGRPMPCKWDQSLTVPEDCQVSIARLLPSGRTGSSVGYVRFDEFARTVRDAQSGKVRLMKMWAEKPYHMTAKCAKSQGIDLMFQAETGAVYSQVRAIGAVLDARGGLVDDDEETPGLGAAEQAAIMEGARRGFTPAQSLDGHARELQVREQTARREAEHDAKVGMTSNKLKKASPLGGLWQVYRDLTGEPTGNPETAEEKSRRFAWTRACGYDVDSWVRLAPPQIDDLYSKAKAQLDERREAEGAGNGAEPPFEPDPAPSPVRRQLERSLAEAPKQGDLAGTTSRGRP